MEDLENEIIRYVEGLSVSEGFLIALRQDANIINKVTQLRQDIALMSSVKNSDFVYNLPKKANLTINSDKKVDSNSILAFTFITPQFARDLDVPNAIYAFRNVSVIIESNLIKLMIQEIKEKCIVSKNEKHIIEVGSVDTIIETLESGVYKIYVDGADVQITLCE